MASAIDEKLTILLPVPRELAEEARLEFTIGEDAILRGEDPRNPDAEPTIVLDARQHDLLVVKVAGHAPILLAMLERLFEEASRAWAKEQDKKRK